MDSSYYFYLARCADGSLYAGICRDLSAREAMHNSGKGAKYTRSRLPIRFVYHELFPTRSAASQREYEVKRWRKIRKEELIHTADASRMYTHTRSNGKREEREIIEGEKRDGVKGGR